MNKKKHADSEVRRVLMICFNGSNRGGAMQVLSGLIMVGFVVIILLAIWAKLHK